MITIHGKSSKDDSTKDSWNEFVKMHPESHCYHLAEWQRIIKSSFRLKSTYLYAVDENQKVCGVLPLVLSKSLLFGTFLTSIPFYNYSGVLADSDEVANALLDRAVEYSKKVGASHIEFRHCKKSRLSLPEKTHKVRMVLELPEDSQVLLKGFKAKLRSQIKRAQRENMEVKFGRIELLKDFYEVFSMNMRDLGTPVWTSRIFKDILSLFPEHAKICMVYIEGKPAAAGFLIGYKEFLEIPSASSLREYNRLSPNMLLYWSVLEFGCKEGYKYFDFGRSSPEGGTYKFKKQWGAQPETLHWQYWLKNGQDLPELNPQNPKYQLMIRTWQKIPVPITKIIGPIISRNLP